MSFQAGDVVKLKSGGTKMTISHQTSSDSYFCVWFTKNEEYHSEVFKVATLQAYVEPEKPQAAPLKTNHSW